VDCHESLVHWHPGFDELTHLVQHKGGHRNMPYYHVPLPNWAIPISHRYICTGAAPLATPSSPIDQASSCPIAQIKEP
jgi:hypothetical protein